MHLVLLNLTNLMIGLFRGTIECEPTDSKADWPWFILTGDIWKDLGRFIQLAAAYLPGCFGRPPRNPVEKINSGYKAWEFLLLVFGFFPALLEAILPEKYWKNFCQLVFGIRLLHQKKITKVELVAAHKALIQFSEDFETLYYQRRVDRLHFCCPSVHQTPHAAPETMRWAVAVGDGYVLLRAKDTCSRDVRPCEAESIRRYVQEVEGECMDTWVPSVTRWARLQLPNGLKPRSAWKEKLKPLSQIRITHNVKICRDGQWDIGEVQFYFRLRIRTTHKPEGTTHTVALISLYEKPDTARLSASYGAVWASVYQGDGALAVIDVKNISSLAAMVPYDILSHTDALERARGSLVGHRYFLLDKPGLDIIFMGGGGDDDDDEE
ncbi:hypothetical protein OF83DRAFT_1166864 [Amylostereum chailletii]|nr:hypothetical protein OF83DRAFT_1166864 [Amylostereum chailletii]